MITEFKIGDLLIEKASKIHAKYHPLYVIIDIVNLPHHNQIKCMLLNDPPAGQQFLLPPPRKFILYYENELITLTKRGVFKHISVLEND